MKHHTENDYEYVATLLRYACRQFTEDELQDMPELYRWFRKHDAEHHLAQLKREKELIESRIQAVERRWSYDELEALGVIK